MILSTDPSDEALRQAEQALLGQYPGLVQMSANGNADTAGDIAEVLWRDFLNRWLADTGVRGFTKGFIVGPDRRTSRQADVTLVRPALPQPIAAGLKFPAGGVLATFESKTTLHPSPTRQAILNHESSGGGDLDKTNLFDAFQKLAELRRLAPAPAASTVRDAVNPPIHFGVLALGSKMTAERIDDELARLVHDFGTLPHLIPDVVCVIGLNTWTKVIHVEHPSSTRMPDNQPELADGLVRVSMARNDSDDAPRVLLRLMIWLMRRVAVDVPSAAPMAQSWIASQIKGAQGRSMGGRVFPISILPPAVRAEIERGRMKKSIDPNEPWSDSFF